MIQNIIEGMILDWFYSVPWWAWAILGALIVGLVWKLLGYKAALAAATAALLATTHSRGQQQGWRARQQKEKRDAENAIRRGTSARKRVTPGMQDDGFRRD